MIKRWEEKHSSSFSPNMHTGSNLPEEQEDKLNHYSPINLNKITI